MIDSATEKDPLIELVLECSAAAEDELVWACRQIAPEGFKHEPSEAGRNAVFGIWIQNSRVEEVIASLEAHDIPLALWRVESVRTDWPQHWKKFHNAVSAGKIWVGPPWQRDLAPAGLHAIVIDPGQGFGTGSHPTTWMVLNLMQALGGHGGIVDVGCGSGVLAIAADRLGHKPVIAIDNDQSAVEDAKTQIESNGTLGGFIEVHLGDALDRNNRPIWAGKPVTSLVANIVLNPLLLLAERLKDFPVKNVIVSGLLRSQGERAAQAFAEAGYVVVERLDRDGWVALRLEHSDPGVGQAKGILI